MGQPEVKKRTFNRCFGQHSAITRCDISLIVFSMPFETFIAKLQPCVVHAYFIICLFICSVARYVRVQYSYSTVHTVYMQMNPAWPLAIASPSVRQYNNVLKLKDSLCQLKLIKKIKSSTVFNCKRFVVDLIPSLRRAHDPGPKQTENKIQSIVQI